MKGPISTPLNKTQRRFNELCELGGGQRGGPARGKVLELLSESGRALSQFAFRETAEHLDAFHVRRRGAHWMTRLLSRVRFTKTMGYLPNYAASGRIGVSSTFTRASTCSERDIRIRGAG